MSQVVNRGVGDTPDTSFLGGSFIGGSLVSVLALGIGIIVFFKLFEASPKYERKKKGGSSRVWYKGAYRKPENIYGLEED
jgi:hypothetical protein